MEGKAALRARSGAEYDGREVAWCDSRSGLGETRWVPGGRSGPRLGRGVGRLSVRSRRGGATAAQWDGGESGRGAVHQDGGSGHGGSETEAQPPRGDGHMSTSFFFFFRIQNLSLKKLWQFGRK